MKVLQLDAKNLFPIFLKKNTTKIGKRTGLYLMLYDIKTNTTMGYLIGNLTNEELIKKMRFAMKKITTLIDNEDDLTTFRAQNYATQDYGGGIRFSNMLISCSGLPPELDHKFLVELIKQSHLQDVYKKELKKINKEFEKYKNQGVS